jgi:flagellar hook-basal body complex protein FliE
MTSYFPNYDLAGRIQHTKFSSGFNMPSIRLDRVEKPETQDFKQVFSGLVENFNNDLNAPDDLLKDVMQGNKNVDIHDVMVAMSKTEISVNIATQAVGKVINAYDRIMQINV